MDTVTETGVVGNVFSVDREIEKNGYDFTGWYTDPDCTIPAEDFVLEGGDYTLYAGFEKINLLAGDVNGDSIVNIRDLSMLRSYLAALIPVSIVNADINGDGLINLRDLKVLKGLLAS